ncbi:MAG TPA: integrase arm-type DNA-binding domain-containing protein [Rhodanobacteraceae bacterium]|nr:integrase arm-type DNA-binding domain-containing protein [Rhodanobacteraceae bacterium]
MPLTPSAVANVKSRTKPYKLADERGLFLLVQPNGSRWWRFKYRRPSTKKENLLSLGIYPDVSLKKARERRDDARKLIADGIDPGDKRKAESLAGADTFEAIAVEWMEQTRAKRATKTNETIKTRLERDLFPWLGRRPINDIKGPELLMALRRVEDRGSPIIAKRLRQIAEQISGYAMATGRAERNVAVDLRGAMKSRGAERHHAALTAPADVGALMRAIEGYSGQFMTRCALQLLPLFFVRPGELRNAEWHEFDLDAAQWCIPAAKMKMRQPHIVPLSTQALAILRELYPLTGGGITGKPDAACYLFPCARSRARPMSNNTINAALRRIGYTRDQMTAHGFRATARTLLAERGLRPDAIERQLAHKASGPLGAAYDRAQFLDERRKMMQEWADYLDSLRAGATLIPIKQRAFHRTRRG